MVPDARRAHLHRRRVIIVTLLLSNFLLPVIAPNKAKDVPRETTEASIEVLRRTVRNWQN